MRPEPRHRVHTTLPVATILFGMVMLLAGCSRLDFVKPDPRRRDFDRTAPEIRVLFKKGQLGSPGSNKFLFDHVGLVEAHCGDPGADIEAAAIEAGADEVLPLSHEQNDDIPADRTGARFITDRTQTAVVSKWLSQNGWTVVTSELGYVPKQYPELDEASLAEVGEFLQALDDHDDVHRVWAAVK